MPIIQKRSLPYNKNLKTKSQTLRKTQTKAENKLWYEFLKSQNIQFYRQKPIHHYIVDFYSPKLKLVIEIDGGSHYTDFAIEYDKERTKILNQLNLKVIRFTNHEVMNNFEEVCRSITLITRQAKLGTLFEKED